MMVYGDITCKRCGIKWYGPKCGKLYCNECRKIVNREKDARCKEKKKNTQIFNENEKKHGLTFREISRLADHEGLSYGKYCLKYGI